MFRVEFTGDAVEKLKKLDKPTRTIIYSWVMKKLEGCSNPILYGENLICNNVGKWKYRIGKYRLIADIRDNKIVILALSVERFGEYVDQNIG